MKIIPIYPPLRDDQNIRCVHCWMEIKTGGYADIEGRAFVDYYCEPCKIIFERSHARAMGSDIEDYE